MQITHNATITENCTLGSQDLSPPTILVWDDACSAGTMTIQLASLAKVNAMYHDKLQKLGAEASEGSREEGIVHILDCISSPETPGKCFEVATLSSASSTSQAQRHLVHTTP